MKKSRARELRKRKRRIEHRLRTRDWEAQETPMFNASGIHYEISERSRGLACGGIGALHKMAHQVGLVASIDDRLELLKRHLPYHESDHVLNIAYNALVGGRCLEDLERLRNDEVYLDALGAQRIPDPTTAGDFCRRFEPSDVDALLEAIQAARRNVWDRQPAGFFDCAVLDVDGTLVETQGECKEGMDVSYKGVWGFHPLLVSLSNTQEPLVIENRSGNRPSHENAAARIDEVIRWCREAGFRRVRVRGDTDFTQTKHLDRWDADGVEFVFGIDAMPNLKELASKLDSRAWKRLRRPDKYVREGPERARPARVKEEIVQERDFKNIRLESEDVIDVAYRPVACSKDYRLVIVRKNLSIERGERVLFDDVRYFFYLTNDWSGSAAEIVFDANDRCDQENLIGQLKEVRALHAPVGDLVSNWAYMVMVSLAWTMKAWFALLLPESGRWGEKYAREKQRVLRMQFRTFVNHFVQIPVQIVRKSRRLIYRILAWNPWLHVFLRGWDQIASRC